MVDHPDRTKTLDLGESVPQLFAVAQVCCEREDLDLVPGLLSRIFSTLR